MFGILVPRACTLQIPFDCLTNVFFIVKTSPFKIQRYYLKAYDSSDHDIGSISSIALLFKFDVADEHPYLSLDRVELDICVEKRVQYKIPGAVSRLYRSHLPVARDHIPS